jgi:hypothetical protein
MEVEHYARATFLVTCNGETFHCDLLRYNGNGQCDCYQFVGGGRPPARRREGIRDQIERAVAAGTFVPGPLTKCPHIAAADAVLLDMFKQQLLKQFPTDKQET